MTLSYVIQILDTFRDEYNTSTDTQVKDLCKYVSCTIDNLNKYIQIFETSKSQIERSQTYYASSLETINKLLQDNQDVIENP